MKFLYSGLLVLLFASCGGSNEDTSGLTPEESINSYISSLESNEFDNLDEANGLISSARQLLDQIGESDPALRVKLETRIKHAESALSELNWEVITDIKSGFLDGKILNATYWALAGDSIRIEMTTDDAVNVIKVYETRSLRSVKEFKRSKGFELTYDVYHDNVFNITFSHPKPIYYSLKISRKPKDLASKFSKHSIEKDSVILEKPTANSVKAYELITESVYMEPQKYTLQHGFWSGTKPIYAAIEVPANTKYFVYSMTISGEDEEQYRPKAQQLVKDVNKKTAEYRVMGIPVFSSTSTSTSLLRDLLNGLDAPSRAEDQSADLYFLDSQSEVQKFLNGEKFKYDIDNSVLATQSRNGIIKRPKTGYSYFVMYPATGDNTQYVWFDVVALYEKEFHYELRYSLR